MHKRSMNIVTASWQVYETRRNCVDKVEFPTFGLCPGVSLVYHPKKTHGWNLNWYPFEKRNQKIINNIIFGFQPLIFGGAIVIYKLVQPAWDSPKTGPLNPQVRWIFRGIWLWMLDFTTRMLDFKQHNIQKLVQYWWWIFFLSIRFKVCTLKIKKVECLIGISPFNTNNIYTMLQSQGRAPCSNGVLWEPAVCGATVFHWISSAWTISSQFISAHFVGVASRVTTPFTTPIISSVIIPVTHL